MIPRQQNELGKFIKKYMQILCGSILWEEK